MEKIAITPFLLLTLSLTSCATLRDRTSAPPDYWGIVPLLFNQVVSDPSTYSTEKGKSLIVKYKTNLENVFLDVRKTYKPSEIEFFPYVPYRSTGLSFMKQSESKSDERFVTIFVVASSAYFDKEQSTYYERAAAIFSEYGRSLLEIALQETQVINDPDVKGIWIFIAWSTLNVQQTATPIKRGEGFGLIAAKEDCRKFTSNVLAPQEFANRAKIYGIQEGRNLGTISLPVGPTMKVVNKADKRTVAEFWYDEGIELNLAKKLRVAISAFDRAIEVDPNFSEAYYHRGTNYTTLGIHDVAVKDVEKAVETAPRGSKEQYMRAGFSALKNNPEESCRFLKMAINAGFESLDLAKIDANFDSIRNTACYKEIMVGK
jgi:tetratricopeptide (TPR) repeat protein